MSFALEAQRILAGGGAERNHRKRVKIYSQPRRGDRPASVCRPSGAPVGVFDCVRWFLHRLISAAPPAQKTCVETLAGLLCATNATEGTYETRTAHSLFNLANIASPRGRSIRLKGDRADAAARKPSTYCFGQRARDHRRQTDGKRQSRYN